jgi:hypothetical protein
VISAPTKSALPHPVRRYQQLSQQLPELDAELHPLVQVAAPALLELPGAGPEVAGPVPASTGTTPVGCAPHRPSRAGRPPRGCRSTWSRTA